MSAEPVAQPPQQPGTSGQDRLRLLTHLVYALQALGFFTLVTPLIGVIVNYVKLEDAAGGVCQSHFRWQIRTFWWMLLWTLLGVLTWVVLIGQAVLLASAVWYLYRIIKGWLRLLDGKPMY